VLPEEESVTDPAHDIPPVTPEYGGTADEGVVSSVGEHAGAAGDVVDALRAEHDKLHGVFEELRRLLDAGDEQALRLRFGGVVREVLEHEAAEARVVLPAAEQVSGQGSVEEVRRRSQEVVRRLQRYDEMTADDLPPGDVAEVVDLTSEHLRTVDAVVLPLLEQLPAEERMRLGEDLRQVMG
jgi:hemerythrin superfamily protein